MISSVAGPGVYLVLVLEEESRRAEKREVPYSFTDTGSEALACSNFAIL